MIKIDNLKLSKENKDILSEYKIELTAIKLKKIDTTVESYIEDIYKYLEYIEEKKHINSALNIKEEDIIDYLIYLDKNNYEMLLTNFRQTKKVKNIDDFKITIYFNDKEWSSNGWNKNKDISFRKFLKNIIVYEEDTEYIEENSPNFRRSSDAFIETSPDEFKSAIKVEVKYCYKNKCNTENMKIKFID